MARWNKHMESINNNLTGYCGQVCPSVEDRRFKASFRGRGGIVDKD